MVRRLAVHTQQLFSLVDVLLVTLVGVFVLVEPTVRQSAITQTGFGLVAVFLAPGYAFVAALFPRERPRDQNVGDGWTGKTQHVTDSSPTRVERLLLSIGLSACLVPLLGLGLHFSPMEITRTTVLGVLGTTTVVLGVVALGRRWQVPWAERFKITGNRERQNWLARRRSWSRSLFQVVFVVGIILVSAGLVTAIWHPTQSGSEEFTELSVVGSEQATGDRTGEDSPNGVSSRSLDLEITNREGEKMDYVVVSKLQQFSPTDGRRVMVAETELERFSISVATGETRQLHHSLDRDVSEGDVRITYLLYSGEPPADTTVENAYRWVHVWVGDSSS
jgi:uncharacterized membrane protein